MKRNTCRILLCAAAVALVALAAWAQGSDQAQVANSSQLKFGPIPNVPSCLTLSPEHGDPSKGASTLLLKFTSGCTVPMHWHTATEELMIVSGSGKVQMQDGKTSTVEHGGFVHMPPKHPHQFTCVTACTLFLATDGPFDIHYVDKSGTEITLEQALSTSKPAPAAKKKTM